MGYRVLRSPPRVFGSYVGPSLFRAEDVAKFAEAAGLPIPSANHLGLVQELMKAILNAHTAQEISKQIAPAGQRRQAYVKAAKASRSLLAALGCVESNLGKLATSKDVCALDSCNLLRELGREDEDSESQSPNEEFAELPRALAKLILTAERMAVRSQKGSPSGPAPDAFSPRLLDGLVDCYHHCFHRWPVPERKDGERKRRPGSAVRWVRAVLTHRLRKLESQSSYAAVSLRRVPRFSNEKRLKENLEALLANSDATLEDKVGQATSRMKHARRLSR